MSEQQELLSGAVTLAHGDRVMLCVSNDVESADYTWMREVMQKWFPGVEFCVAANVTGVLVQRGEAGNGSEEDQ